MGLSWQQGPIATGAIGRFLIPGPVPVRMPFAEPLRRRMRVRFGGAWIADSEDVVLLHEPGRYPVAYFPFGDVARVTLTTGELTTRHPDFGPTAWYSAQVGETTRQRAAYQHTEPPEHASELRDRIAFAWRAMDAFYEEDERILGHAADPYHRIDIRRTSRRLTVHHDGRTVADTHQPLALYESGFAPRWYVPRADVDEAALRPVDGQTFCPYKGVCDYYDVTGAARAAWSYQDAFTEVSRISGLVSFEPDKVEVCLDGTVLRLAPGQSVIPHGVDRALTVDEAMSGRT